MKPGQHLVVIQIDDAQIAAESAKVIPKAGCLKGIWMAPDFDAPLEDFREYME